jgi:hypothetical protein
VAKNASTENSPLKSAIRHLLGGCSFISFSCNRDIGGRKTIGRISFVPDDMRPYSDHCK